jgi:hypothetical protein
MPRRFICPQDHEWEASLDAGDVAGGQLACPVCGATDLTCLRDEPATEPAPSHPNCSWVLPRVPGYDVLGELGHGGMGVVYRAFDRRRKQAVALKTLQGFSPSALLRFKREFRTLAEVTHPNLVTLFEPVFDGTQWYFTMELVEGVDFLRHVRGGVIASAPTVPTSHLPDAAHRNDPGDGSPRPGSAPSAEQLARLRAALRQLADGVTALHEAGKLHRDIKPGNVLVTPQGRVVLLDFGLAADLGALGQHESSQPHLAGTVPYMSPEQVACRPLSPATDWYSVGVMLFETLTGRLPFEGNTHAILRAKLERDAPPPGSLVAGLPGDLAVLTEHLLRRRPEDRPSAREVRQVLGETPDAAPAAPPQAPAADAAFLGRQKELAALHEALEATRRGRTRTVLVHGPSGMGKSALVRHFLESAAAHEDAVALLGRCYERESVPYKALDSLVDALSGYLRRLTEADVQALLPRDAALLARVFPVLGRVPAVAAAPRRDIEFRDVHELRRRAFAALRELLARLGDRRRLLLFIDDLQWGDTDSGLLLAELVRPPDAPALLLLASFRREDREASPCLRALLQAWDQPDLAPDRSEVAVDPLPPAQAQELARTLLGPEAEAGQVEAVARESGGSPLFIQELAQYVRSEDGWAAPGGAVTLDEMLWSRIERLPADERRLLEVVAVAGRPLAPALARQAAELQVDERGLVAHLRSVRLLRGTGSAEGGEIETYHDRVREAVTAHLPPPTLEAHHGRLAGVLEAAGPPDPELLAVHLQEAGERRRAGTWYVRAADQAAETLAFDRAARLYRRGLDLRTLQGKEERALRVRLAEALAHAGRGPESAREYLGAAQSAGPDEVFDLRRHAALRLLTCGHYREGLQTLRPLLEAAGLHLPGGPGRALLTLLWLRLRLRLRGLGFTPRPPHEIPVEDIRYMDVCWSTGVGLFPVDLLAAWGFLTRALLKALSAGDSLRIARGLALEAAFLVSGGGRRRTRLAAEALQVADRVARESRDPAVSGLVLLARGMASFSVGSWAEACDLFDQSEAVFREHGVGAAFEINLARLYSLLALYYRGEIDAISHRAALLYQEGRERDDFLMVMLAGLVKLYGPLAADDPEGVRRGLAEIVEHCPEKGVELLRHNVRVWQLNLDLYCGDGAAVLRRLGEPLAPMERVMVSRSRHLRIPWEYKRGCCFLAAAEASPDRGWLLRSAGRCARRLRGEGLAWADALAGLLQAGVAACGGDRAGAAATLGEAASLFDAAGMLLHAAVARRRLGECLPGGGELIAQADTAITERGVRNPLRMTALVAPGFRTG